MSSSVALPFALGLGFGFGFGLPLDLDLDLAVALVGALGALGGEVGCGADCAHLLVQTGMNAESAPDAATTADRIAQLFRFLTAGLLLFIAFYLQIFAQFGSPKEGNEIPLGYRWPPLLLGLLILDRARSNGFVPFGADVLAVVIYGTALYLLWKAFVLILDRYEVPTPRERIPDFVRELVESIRN